MDEESGLETRLQLLLAKRGQELVKGLTDEIMRLHREIAALQRELKALGEYQTMRDRWLGRGETGAKGATLPRNVVIAPDQMISLRDGFYPAEVAGDGTAFRWTGPSREFVFDVFVERRWGGSLKLDVLNCIDYEAQKDLALFVDGVPATVEIEQQGSGFAARAALAASDEGRSTNLVFVLPAVLTPPGSEDERLLGVAFGKLTVCANGQP
ncbi:MAG TPA: hypothetical protein VG889_04355 [Rhizomicrobium sp.]|nr:hypothetical protein [Rhizomicrobium sp.]